MRLANWRGRGFGFGPNKLGGQKEKMIPRRLELLNKPSGTSIIEVLQDGIRGDSVVKIIRQSNSLIGSRFDLTLTENKFRNYLMTRISKDDKKFYRYRVYIKNFIEVLPGNRQHLYHEARTIIKKLMRDNIIEIKYGKTTRYYALIIGAEYKDDEGCIDFTFHPELKSLLLELKERYTSYNTENVYSLKSVHGFRLYEILKSKQNMRAGKYVVNLLELREMLNVKDQYKEFNNFKINVLDRAKKELSKHTDITFTYKTKISGRRVKDIQFTIRPNRKKLQEIQKETERQLVKGKSSSDKYLKTEEFLLKNFKPLFGHEPSDKEKRKLTTFTKEFLEFYKELKELGYKLDYKIGSPKGYQVFIKRILNYSFHIKETRPGGKPFHFGFWSMDFFLRNFATWYVGEYDLDDSWITKFNWILDGKPEIPKKKKVVKKYKELTDEEVEKDIAEEDAKYQRDAREAGVSL